MRRFSKNYAEEGIIVLFTALTSTFSVILSFVGYDVLINPTYAAEVLLYYVYTYSQYTKRDPLTKLFNRYMKRKERMVSGIISIDMNELKWINDTMGHDEGDKAIKKIAECILQPTTTRETVYRVGGDEFIVICCHGDQNHIEQLVFKMRSSVDASGYSCAFGICCDNNKSLEDMIKEADRMMYKDKAKIKEEAAAMGKELHFRT